MRTHRHYSKPIRLALSLIGGLAVSLSSGCMKMFEDMGMVETTTKSGKPPTKVYGEAEVTHGTSRSSKSNKSNKSKPRNIFQREPEKSEMASGGQPDYLADTETNIIRVNKIVNSSPWLSFDPDGTRKVDGIRITVYLEAADRPKGVFGDGTITVQMYRLEKDKAGQETAALAQEWVLPPEKAYQWRATEESMLGKGYSLRLRWDEKAKVNGKQVAVLVKYERPDGRKIASTRQVLKVPASPTVVAGN